MDVIARINEIMKAQGISRYELAKLSGLSSSTLANMKRRNTVPTIATLEELCSALIISLSQFFAGEDTEFYPVDGSQREFLDLLLILDTEQQKALLNFVKTMIPSNDDEKTSRQ